MKCESCGKEYLYAEGFCSDCGADLRQQNKKKTEYNSYFSKAENADLPYQTPAYSSISEEPTKGLGWANLLGYFGFCASALANLIFGFRHITGIYLGHRTALLQAMHPALLVLDFIIGILFAVATVLGIIAAVSVLKKKKKSLLFVPGTFILAGLFGALYGLGMAVITGAPAMFAIYTPYTVFNMVMFFVNGAYFNKRKDIFCK